MIKSKQLEIIEKTFNKIKAKYPLIELGEISFGDKDTWVDIIIPQELEEDDEFHDLIANLCTDIIMDYGYSIDFYTIQSKKNLTNIRN